MKGDDAALAARAVRCLKRAQFAPYRPATVRYGENDVWGHFDILAVHPDFDSVLAIQVKSNKATGINAWRRQTWLWRRLGFRTQYWVPVDYYGWRIIEVRDNDHVDVVDEREMDCNFDEGLVSYLKWLRGAESEYEL